MVAMPRPAFAVDPAASVSCNAQVNQWTCAGTEPEDLDFQATGTFWIHFGPADPFISTFSGASPAVTIDANGNSTTSDGIHFFQDSSINNSEGHGVDVYDVGDVVMNIDGAEGEGGAVSIKGTIGIFVDGQAYAYDSESDTWTGEGGTGDFITINNYGHVEGTNGAGIHVVNVGGVYVNNHSYTSAIGATDGNYFATDNEVHVDNQMGLTAGLGDSGLYFTGIGGLGIGSNAYAVSVDNTRGGVIAGYSRGIYASNIGLGIGEGDSGNFLVNNYAYYQAYSGWVSGGLIAGVNSRGIYANTIAGDFIVNNGLTKETSIDLTQLDPLVHNGSTGLLDGSALPSGFTTGIYGRWDGIKGDGIGGAARVDNRDGRIVGAGGDGVDLRNVKGAVTVNNAYTGYYTGYSDLYTSGGGTIWGGDNGVQVTESGEVNIFNDLGWTTGVHRGLSLQGVGRTIVGNIGGDIVGYYGDGINITANANGDSSDKVGIYNTGSYALDWTYGSERTGFIVGGDTAINVMADNTFIANGYRGAIIGDGRDSEGQPVLRLNSTGTGSESESGGILNLLGLNLGSVVFNDGVMTSDNNPEFLADAGTRCRSTSCRPIRSTGPNSTWTRPISRPLRCPAA